jgi:hypothetical protein
VSKIYLELNFSLQEIGAVAEIRVRAEMDKQAEITHPGLIDSK